MPLPSWLTEPPTNETDPRSESPGKEDTFNGTEEDEAFEQQYVDYGQTNPLAFPGVLKDLRKCKDVDGFYDWAATHGIDVKRYSTPLFRQLCHDGKPLSLLLHVLEDAGLRTHYNFQSLFKWLLGDHGERRQKGLLSDDMALMQQWIGRQFHLGLMDERDTYTFLKFLKRVIHTTHDESSVCNLIASFDGLQSSPVLRFKDLGLLEQRRIVKLIARGPVTRPLLEMGLRFIEAMPYPPFEGTDQRIAFFIQSVLYTHTSGHKDGKQVLPSPELVPTILETIWALPEDLKDSVILTTTKALLSDCVSEPAMKVVVPDLWLSALAKKISRGNWSLKARLEDFLGTQKLEIVVPYLQHFDDRKQARFVLRHWFGYRTIRGHHRALRLFHDFFCKKRKESSWVSMLQAAQLYARKYLQRLDVPIRTIFKFLQALGQSESIVEIVKQSRKLQSVINDDDVVYIIREHLEQRPHLAERLFHFHPRLWLERCPELAERMILDPGSHPANAQRYMRRYCPLFLLDPERYPRERYTHRRRQLLGRMALAYSSALHLPPEVAFKRVYECYTQHMLEDLGPLPIATARALTRAGLIRPLQSGQCASTEKIRWILSVVWSTEGADVADQVEELVYKWREANWR